MLAHLLVLALVALGAAAFRPESPLFRPSHGSSFPVPSDTPGDQLNLLAPKRTLSTLSSDGYTTLTHDAIPGYTVRIRQAEDFCDSTVRAYTGYLDVAFGSKHLFFYFFESRSKPETDDLVAWFNGGPGCSSAVGLFMELGPCRVNEQGNGTVFNPYGWNDKANLFILDQPVGVGFSYADYGETVETSEDAAKDVAAFVFLFMETFTEFKGRPFHLAGESYGGRYLPVFASKIVDENKRAVAAGVAPINLKSVLIGNGYTDLTTILPSYYDMTCTNVTLPPVLDIGTCVRMKRAIPRCQKMLNEACFVGYDDMSCTAAFLFCQNELEQPYWSSGRNPYDLSDDCTGGRDVLCYPITGKIRDYLNRNETRKLIGVDEAVKVFATCSDSVGAAFNNRWDMVHSTTYYIAGLLERGVDVLIYVGSYDWICNWVGNKRWVEALEWHGQERYNSEEMGTWEVDGRQAGITKGYGGLVFATIEGAGHMVPYDKPVEALAMLNRWLEGRIL